MSDAMLFIISLGITMLGLAASYGVARRRGAASGLRGAAWSMVPLAATMTGVTEFVTELVFSPAKWAGVVLAGLAVTLFLVSGVMLRREIDSGSGKARRGRAVRDRADGGRAGRAGTGEAGRRPQRAMEQSAGSAPLDPDLKEIEDILRRRGIQ